MLDIALTVLSSSVIDVEPPEWLPPFLSMHFVHGFSRIRIVSDWFDWFVVDDESQSIHPFN